MILQPFLIVDICENPGVFPDVWTNKYSNGGDDADNIVANDDTTTMVSINFQQDLLNGPPTLSIK